MIDIPIDGNLILGGAVGAGLLIIGTIRNKNMNSYFPLTRNNPVFQKLINSDVGCLKSSKYISRSECDALKTVCKTVILKGEPRSSKITFIANHLLKNRFPWYQRMFAAPNIIYLQGDCSSWHKTFRDWLKYELSVDLPVFQKLKDHIIYYSHNQYVRRSLLNNFPKLPKIFHPLPTVIVIDQTDVLIRRYGENFLSEMCRFFRTAQRQPEQLELYLIVSSTEAVESLQAIRNGRDLFQVVDVPLPDVKNVEKEFGCDFASVFKDLNCNVGMTRDYMDNNMTGFPTELLVSGGDPHQVREQRQKYHQNYVENYQQMWGVHKALTKEELENMYIRSDDW